MARTQNERNICKALNFDRYLGVSANRGGPSSTQTEVAEKSFLRRIYNGQQIIRKCDIPNSKAKFLIVFSPDGTKLACTNGNHNIYIIDVNTKESLKTLTGHQRTPWTIAFHPTDNNILASGCLGGEVRVWNLKDDTNELWCSNGQTAIASLAFHPKVPLLVIATYKDLYFWHWSISMVYDQASTVSEEEKIRYVKFDSTGDKLITAIALKNNLLSQYDSISFREVYEFMQQRDVLKEFQLIEKFLMKHISKQKEGNASSENKNLISSGQKMKSLEIIGLNNRLPYMCAFHYRAFQNCLNVECFCPTEFSNNVMKMFKTNILPIDQFSDVCYFCRYTWLYTAVFKRQLMISSKSHICFNQQIVVGEKHTWVFSNQRLQELLAENDDVNCGLTEEVFKYCFVQYARIHIAPHFASRIPDGVCSNCFTIIDFPSYPFDSGVDESRRPFSHDIPERSDCFLNVCDTFGFEPTGYFSRFLNSFAELYQYFPSLREIATRNDCDKLDLIMTEWECLYCKLLLFNRVIEGDKYGLLKKISLPQQQSLKCQGSCILNPGRSHQILVNESSNDEAYISARWNENIDYLIRKNKKFSLSKQNNLSEVRSECNLCKNFDMGDENSSVQAIKVLRQALDKLYNSISRRYDQYNQRDRIQRLFEHQLVHNVSKTVGALLRTIQVTKRCIERQLLMFITELKRLLKLNFLTFSSCSSQFQGIFFRMFVFIVQKIVSFSNTLLEFICDFNYDVTELLLNEYIRFDSPLRNFSLNQRTLIHFMYSRHIDQYYVNNWTSQPIFEEEDQLLTSELLNEDHNSSTMRVCSQLSSSSESLRRDIRALSERGVIASDTSLIKHVRFLHTYDESRLFDPPSDTNWESLQNVGSLFGHFQLQIQEDTKERIRHHPLHRLQTWDFSKLEIPDISSRHKNIVVTECKVHNDATIAISNDDSFVAVLLSPNQFDQSDWFGVFSLQWRTLGQILCCISSEQLAVSLSFSPTNQFLTVGYSYSYRENMKMADVISIKREIDTWRDYFRVSRPHPVATSLIDIPRSESLHLLTTINCIKWLSVPGEGIVYGNSIGEIKFVL